MTPHIEVHKLRVGMYVQLDLGWISHPFARSSFKILDAGQIAAICALGVPRVRWDPDKSDPAPPDVATAPDSVAPSATTAVEPPRPVAVEPAGPVGHTDALSAQRASQSLIERQYAQACRDLRAISDGVRSQPKVARERAEALIQGLLDKMVGDRDLCIRLLTEGSGDRATAHAMNVTIVSLLLGQALKLTANVMTELGLGAMLHDIGKIEVIDRVRYPDDDFTVPEQTAYRQHVAHGIRLAERMELPPGVLLTIAQHHEQADGSGFPLRLQLGRVSRGARIVALVNRYDNLCTPLKPSKAMTPHDALSSLYVHGEKKFDSTTLSSFIKMMGVYPPGSLLQLSDGRYGMVTAVNASRSLKPHVLVHDPKVARRDALHLDLTQCPGLTIARSLHAAQLPADALEYLAPPRRLAYFFEGTDRPTESA